jgi:hypothetical protein
VSLFTAAIHHRISFLDAPAAGNLITLPARDSYEVSPAAVARILEITSGHPYYTQLICHCIFAGWQQAPRPCIRAKDVDNAVEQAVELGSANLAAIWADSSPAEKAVLAGIAAAQADRERNVQESARVVTARRVRFLTSACSPTA